MQAVLHASGFAVVVLETDLAGVPVVLALFDVWQHVAIDLKANLVGIMMLYKYHCPGAN